MVDFLGTYMEKAPLLRSLFVLRHTSHGQLWLGTCLLRSRWYGSGSSCQHKPGALSSGYDSGQVQHPTEQVKDG
jgi:hypothetical protein